jgi:hypothetical protein
VTRHHFRIVEPPQRRLHGPERAGVPELVDSLPHYAEALGGFALTEPSGEVARL